jgi:hypothetical protein
MEEFKEGFAKTFSEEQAKVNAQTNTQFSSIQNQLTAIVQAQSQSAQTALENKTESDTRLKALEDRFDSFQSSRTEAVGNAVNVNLLQAAVQNPSDDPSWKASLGKDVFEHEHGLIIHGIRLEGNHEDAKRTFI